MKIIFGFPPNYAELNARFKIRGKTVFISYADRIYSPMKVQPPPEIIAHEKVHGRRQLAIPHGPAMWWKKWVDDPAFRLGEELLGHKAELAFFGNPTNAQIDDVARRLSGPLYGNLISFRDARTLLVGNQG